MEWKKAKFTRWTFGAYTITEEADPAGRPFRLDSPRDYPEFFETLDDAKGAAALRNELEVTKAEVAKLRAELAQQRGQWPTPAEIGAAGPTLPAAVADKHPAVCRTRAGAINVTPAPGSVLSGSAARAAARQPLPATDDGRGIPVKALCVAECDDSPSEDNWR